ncbi:hypothetical protein GBAR_LOCUS7300, partial [Geodia barretti]
GRRGTARGGRRVRRGPRPFRERQDDASEHHRRAGHAHIGKRVGGRTRYHHRIALGALRAETRDRELHLPELQSVPRAHRLGERRVRRGRGREARQHRSRFRARVRRTRPSDRPFPPRAFRGRTAARRIARALATGNPVLLADEPTGELDFRPGRRYWNF